MGYDDPTIGLAAARASIDAGVIFATHNEHIFVPTQLIELFTLVVDGVQYNAVFVCVINQIIYSVIAAALIVAAVPLFGIRARSFVAAVTLYVCLPYDFENIAQPVTNMYVFLLGRRTCLSVARLLAAAARHARSATSPGR